MDERWEKNVKDQQPIKECDEVSSVKSCPEEYFNSVILGSDNESDFKLLSLAKKLQPKYNKLELNLKAKRKIKKVNKGKRKEVLVKISDKEQRLTRKKLIRSRWLSIKFAAKLS